MRLSAPPPLPYLVRMNPRAALLTLALLAPRAAGHDLWLVPDDTAAVGRAVTVRAISGTAFPLGDRPPDPAKFLRRVAVAPDGRERPLDAAGTDATAGLLRFTPDQPGLWAVAVVTAPKLLTLDAESFNEYLISDGLPHIWKVRAKEGSLNQPGRERYAKSPVAYIAVGDAPPAVPRELDLPLTVTPLADPFAVRPGQALAVRVRFHGRPLADARLGWSHPGDGDEPRGTARANDLGVALIPIDRAGPVTVRLTHMTRPKHADYEWESAWTTTTFRARPANSP